MEQYIKNGKVEIFVREEIVADSNKAILLIHGFSEHSGRYMEFINDLKEQNFTVFAMDLRGHGRTISKKGNIESIKKVISDVEAVINYIKIHYNFEKLGIFGHSTGGLAASLFASINKTLLDFIILSSPAIYCPKKYKIIRYIPYKILPFIKIKKRRSESKEMLEYSKNDKYSLHKFSIKSIGVIFDEGVTLLNEVINIKCPVLLTCGKMDTLLSDTDQFQKFMNKLDNRKNKIIIYETGKHRVVHGIGAKERIMDIMEWLKSI